MMALARWTCVATCWLVILSCNPSRIHTVVAQADGIDNEEESGGGGGFVRNRVGSMRQNVNQLRENIGAVNTAVSSISRNEVDDIAQGIREVLNKTGAAAYFDNSVIQEKSVFTTMFGPVLDYFGVPGYDGNFEEHDQQIAPAREWGSECRFCEYDNYNRSQKFIGMTCEEWDLFTGYTKDEECSILRAIAHEHCGCKFQVSWTTPLPPKDIETCTLCEGGYYGDSTYAAIHKTLPTMSKQLTCEDIWVLPGVDPSTTCADISTFADYCGCPEGKTKYQRGKECTFCPWGDSPLFPDKVIMKGDGDSTPELTCSSIHDDMSKLASAPSCFEAHQQVENAVGSAVYDFCGCSTKEAAVGSFEPCSPCPTGLKYNPIEACAKWGANIKNINARDDICERQQTKFSERCCLEPGAILDGDEEEGEDPEAVVVYAALMSSARQTWTISSFLAMLGTTLSALHAFT